MADAVTSNVILNTPYNYAIHLTGIGDGTGESAVMKVDKSTLLSSAGIEPVALDILRVNWNIVAHTNVKFLWDHTTDDLALVLSGYGTLDFTGQGILRDTIQTGGLADPGSTGGTGDLLITVPNTANGVYAITLWLKKRV